MSGYLFLVLTVLCFFGLGVLHKVADFPEVSSFSHQCILVLVGRPSDNSIHILFGILIQCSSRSRRSRNTVWDS